MNAKTFWDDFRKKLINDTLDENDFDDGMRSFNEI